MVESDVLPPSSAGCCCLLPTEFRRVELMIPKIRMQLKLEWIFGMSRARDQAFAENFLTGSVH